MSRLCLGAATFGNRDWGCDETESAAILDRFLDAGGNFVDTANKYGDGRSEEVLGHLLRERRDRIVLGTKYTASMDDSDPNSSGSHRKSLVLSLEASLRRLRTDYVDLLWVHAWDGITPIAELMRALDDQVRGGRVLHVGVSNAPSWMIGSANALAALSGGSPFVAVQNEYNLLERGAERELLPMARYFGLGCLAWAPLAQGRLTGKYTRPSAEKGRLTPDEVGMSERDHRIASETLAVAEELGCQPATVALRWIIQQQPEVIPIVGARTSVQLEANLSCLDVELSAEQMARLDGVSAIDPGTPTRFMRSGPGRDFMWGRAGTVPRPPAGRPGPWWDP